MYINVHHVSLPIGSMYGIFTYIWHKYMVHVGKYTIHGWYRLASLKWQIFRIMKKNNLHWSNFFRPDCHSN